MNPVKNSIGWADYTWNPVTGCYNGCKYCYAKKIWNRFFKVKYNCEFETVMFHPVRINEPFKKKNVTIFVGSMTDLICYSEYMFSKVSETIRNCPSNTFMFLSKHIESYTGKAIPLNAMVGMTITDLSKTSSKTTVLSLSKYRRPFISIEPISGPVTFNIPPSINPIIVGAETGNRKGKIIPQKEWIQSIKDHASEEKIYWKKNIRKYL